MKTKLRFFIILIVILLALPNNIFAKKILSEERTNEFVDENLMNIEKINLDIISKEDKQALKNKIESLSDKKFDDFIVNSLENSNDKIKLKNNLRQLGVELNLNNNNNYTLCSVPSYDAEIYVTSVRRGSDSYYRLISYVNLKKSEIRPGSPDIIAMYFDSNKAEYYSYNTSTNTSLNTGINATRGTLVFNLYDNRMGTSTEYVSVYVTPRHISSNNWIDFGSDWTHTYRKTSVSGISPSAEITFIGGSIVGGSVGVSVNIDLSVESSWKLADTNAVNANY